MFKLHCKRTVYRMANRSMSRLTQWCSRIFMVEINQKTEPIYFSLSSTPVSAGNKDLEAVLGSRKLFAVYALGDARVPRARSHAHLKRALTQDLPSGCDLLNTASFLPDVENSLVKGFFLRDNSVLSSSEQIVTQLRQKASVCVFTYTREPNGVYLCSDVTDDRSYYVTTAPAPLRHPSTLNLINSDVFYQMKDAYKVLQECSDVIPESKAVLELVEEQQLESNSSQDESFPVIVIEGLDATGKTTLTYNLQKALGAVLLKSPPQCLADFRPRFDTEPPLIRRAFYALGNYITAAQIARESSHAPVIVDRYWHSTAAYAIATAVSGREENLPAVGSEIYEWPCDLLRPSLVLLLSVSPEERLRRLSHRGLDKTEEESQLEINHLFRRKVDEAYRRIQNPACIVVDANPSPDHVLQQVLGLIRNKYNLQFPGQ
ncbi:UMP-CMP kinase 2, mitochondrial [Tachysurus fulvidraco]|uniref:UMP-CMP kinase 2, mitochondrial n=1 Tax=Tachysurus fulvidraco TaxID=1234273 RepID=UPI001FEE2996|nr:UMP-CMP kinase 2, mitochondrial [Tachysurus fulvidraco]